MNLKRAQEAGAKHQQQGEEEHVEDGVGRDHVQHIHPEERRQCQAQAGVDEDDEGAVDEGVANAFGTRFGLLCEEADGHGNHGEDARREQRRQAQPKPQEERPKQTFFSLFGFVAFTLACVLALGVSMTGFAVVAEVLGWGAVVGTVPAGTDVGQRHGDGNFFGRQAHACVTHHEHHIALERVGRIGFRQVKTLVPKDLFLKVLEVHHEVGVVFFDGGALFHVAHGLNAFGQVPFKHGRHRTFVGVVVLAVNVPARIDRCVDDQVVEARLFAGVEADIPGHGVFDLAPREGASHGEPSDERQRAKPLEGNEGVGDHGCKLGFNVRGATKIPRRSRTAGSPRPIRHNSTSWPSASPNRFLNAPTTR